MSGTKEKTIFGMSPMKVLFAMEYVLQGLANPFQGITYQPFFRHFRGKVFGAGFLRKVNFASWSGCTLLFAGLFWVWGLDLISSLIITFFGITFLRKIFLD
jgi:hypothetical protein